MLVGSGDADKCWNRTVQIKQRVHLDRRFGGAEMRPGKQAQAQIDRGRVQRVGGGIEIDAQGSYGVELACLHHEPLRQLCVDTPVASFVGIGQSGATHRRTKAHRMELVRLRVQRSFDIPQPFTVGQLRKSHGWILFGATEVTDTVVASVARNTA